LLINLRNSFALTGKNDLTVNECRRKSNSPNYSLCVVYMMDLSLNSQPNEEGLVCVSQTCELKQLIQK
jgi:hypothetical protein